MRMMVLLLRMLLLLSVQHAASFGFGAMKCHSAQAGGVAAPRRYRRRATALGMVLDKKKSDGGRVASGIAVSSFSAGSIGNFQRVLLAATALPFLAHEEELPSPVRRLISPRARIILAFCAEYLAHRKTTDGWDVDLYANGGYVRDLLLGRISPDLDLSLGLSRCPPNVTVKVVAEGMDAFCQSHPDLDVESVEVMSSHSSAAENKAVDAAQVRLTIGGETVCIDLLPTIKSETYCGNDRIPRRDPRGSAEEDSLRRDLTIGSMLLEVSLQQRTRLLTKKRGKEPSVSSILERARQQMAKVKAMRRNSDFPANSNGEDSNGRKSNNNSATAVASVSAAVQVASDLRFVLLDYHGGIEDLSTRTLRCPVPRNATLSGIYSQVIQSFEEENLAQSLGLVPNDRNSRSNFSPLGKIQALWWAKMIRDDPYRFLRTLRFKETLSFRIDPSFWLAAPFALQPGVFDAKVSNTRKIDELRKVAAGAGTTGLISFVATILSPRIGGSALRDAFFATPLFPNSGNLGVIDITKAQRLATLLPPASGLSLDERVGAALVVSLFSCENAVKAGEGIGANADTSAIPAGTAPSLAHGDTLGFISARLSQTVHLVETACDGLKAPTSIRRAAVAPLATARRLLEPLAVLGMDSLFAQAVALPSGGVSMDEQARQFATMVRIWELLLSTQRKQSSPDPLWVLALLVAATDDSIRSGASSPLSVEIVRRIEADARLLLSLCGGERSKSQGGAVLGGPVAGLPEVPPHLRGHMVAAVQVLIRLRGDSPVLKTPEQLRTYLQVDCDNLLTKLTNEWWVCGGESHSYEGSKKKNGILAGCKLRSAYAKKKKKK